MKRSIVLAISILTVQPVWASQATTFATQAGAIAGFAQACGQDVTLFSGRVGEVISSMATDNADATAATTAFQQSRATQYNAERTNNLVPCTQVLQDYATLPLLRDDYKTSVIARMQQAQASAPTVTPINQTPGGSVPAMNTTPALTPQNQVPSTNASPLPANNSYTVPPPTATIENNNTPTPSPPVPTGPTVMPPANNPAGYP